jgi:probable HAF family extracellular repeat protein
MMVVWIVHPMDMGIAEPTSGSFQLRALMKIHGLASSLSRLRKSENRVGRRIFRRPQCEALERRVLLSSTYTVTDLGALGIDGSGGSGSYATGINAGGQVVGYTTTSGGPIHAFLWFAGKMKDLGTLGGTRSKALGVNGSGDVVGYSYNSTGREDAFLYSGGAMQDLGTLGGGTGVANGINNAGQITGYAYPSDNKQFHAFIYANGSMNDLGTLGGTLSIGNGINAGGQIVGYSSTGQASHAFLYSNGVMHDLGTLGGANSDAYAINTSGQIVGTTSGALYHAFFYDNGSMHDIGTLGGTISTAEAINDAGQTVGTSQISGNVSTHAFLYSNGNLQDLNSLIDSASGWTLSDATGINFHGQIVGTGTNSSGLRRAFLLTPTPTTLEAPTGVQASTGTFTDHVHLSWNAVTGANSYEVWRSTTNSSGAATKIAGALVSAAFDDNSAIPGTIYFYWLKAVNSTGSSASSISAQGSCHIKLVSGDIVGGWKITFPATMHIDYIGKASDGTVELRRQIVWNTSASLATIFVQSSTSPALRIAFVDQQIVNSTGSSFSSYVTALANISASAAGTVYTGAFFSSFTPFTAKSATASRISLSGGSLNSDSQTEWVGTSSNLAWSALTIAAKATPTGTGSFSVLDTPIISTIQGTELVVSTQTADRRALMTGSVSLYNAQSQLVGNKIIGSAGAVVWRGIPIGTYTLKLLSINGDTWAYAAANVVSSKITPITLQQNEPYAADIQVLSSTGIPRTGATLPLGSPITIQILVRNATNAVQAVTVSAQLTIGTSTVSLTPPAARSIPAGGVATFTFFYTPKVAARILIAYQVNTHVSGSYVKTDSDHGVLLFTAANPSQSLYIAPIEYSPYAGGTVSPSFGTAPLTAHLTVTNDLDLWLNVTASGSANPAPSLTLTNSLAYLFSKLGLVAPGSSIAYDGTFKKLGDQAKVQLSFGLEAATLTSLDVILTGLGASLFSDVSSALLKDVSSASKVQQAFASLIQGLNALSGFQALVQDLSGFAKAPAFTTAANCAWDAFKLSLNPTTCGAIAKLTTAFLTSLGSARTVSAIGIQGAARIVSVYDMLKTVNSLFELTGQNLSGQTIDVVFTS